MNLIAQAGMGLGPLFVQYALLVVGVCALIAIVVAVLRYFQVRIHPLVVYLFWIVVIACLAGLAIKLIAWMFFSG